MSQSEFNQISLIPQKWRGFIRAATLVFTLFWIILFLAGIPDRWAELTTLCMGPTCPLLSLWADEAAALASLGLSLASYANFHILLEVILVLVSLIPIGFILWRMSHTWIGILAIMALLSISTNIANVLLALFLHHPIYGIPMAAISRGMLVFIFLFIFLFPTGRLVIPWTKVFIGIGIFWQIFLGDKTLRIFTSDPLILQSAYYWSVLVTMVVTSAAIYSQFYRYRFVSGVQERQQAKYVIAGFISLWLSVLLWLMTIELFPQPPGMPRLLGQTIGVVPVFLLQYFMPVAVSMSILRYRLWDIDIFIRRTLVYGSLTALLLLVYFGSVVLLQLGFRAVTGQNSALAIVISTLAIAALFSPLRKRIQDFIDQRFYRRRYDARLTIETFASMARNESDLEIVTEKFLRAVTDTVQPEHGSLWMMTKEKP
jgi:hypothetical protein